MANHLSDDDLMAVGWARTTGSPTGERLRERQQAGGPAMPSDEDLAAIRAEWDAAGRPPPRPHVHRDTVRLPDGTPVSVVSFIGDDPHRREASPGFGLYLDERWAPSWPHEHLDWADFGVPDPGELRASLQGLLARAHRGVAVEIGCLGGHGRTGTALACLATMVGCPRGEAVDWVRRAYCSHAVETAEQRRFVETFDAEGPSE